MNDFARDLREIREVSKRCDLGAFGRYEQIPVERMPSEMRDAYAYEFTKKCADPFRAQP